MKPSNMNEIPLKVNFLCDFTNLDLRPLFFQENPVTGQTHPLECSKHGFFHKSTTSQFHIPAKQSTAIVVQRSTRFPYPSTLDWTCRISRQGFTFLSSKICRHNTLQVRFLPVWIRQGSVFVPLLANNFDERPNSSKDGFNQRRYLAKCAGKIWLSS